ncbi:hypothetical protein [Microvirus sp.]|nr:hypothetical protein [Microvirus sp.]
MALNAKQAASSLSGGAAAAISAAGDIAGGIIGQLFAKRNIKLQEQSNKRIAKFNQQLEYENQRNAGLLQMQGLKNAGMNVGAMLGGTPEVASAPADGSSMPSSPNFESLGKNSVAALQAAQLNQASIRLAEANAEKAEAEAEGTRIDNSTRDEKNRLNIDNMRKDLSVKDQQIVQSQATVENIQKTFDVFEKNSAKQRWLMDFDANYKFQMAQKLAKDVFWYDRRATKELAKLASSANLDAWQANVCMISFLSQYLDYNLKGKKIKFLEESKFVQKDDDGNVIFSMNGLDWDLVKDDYMKFLEKSLVEAGLSESEAHSAVYSKEWLQWVHGLFTPVAGSAALGAKIGGMFIK